LRAVLAILAARHRDKIERAALLLQKRAFLLEGQKLDVHKRDLA